MLKEMLSSGSKVSSKRVLAAVTMALLIICTLTEWFTNLSVSNATFENIVYLIGANILAIASEGFTKNKDTNEKPTD